MQKIRQETFVIGLLSVCSDPYLTPGTRDSRIYFACEDSHRLIDKWRSCPYCTGGRSREMPKDSQPREGILSTTTFPGLVYSVLRRKETGVLTLTGDTIEKSIYIQSGRPVFATSNDRDDRVGQIFFKAGLLGPGGTTDAPPRGAAGGQRGGPGPARDGLGQT